MAGKNGVDSEGSYPGSKDYNDRTKKFVQSGKVAKAARDAKPMNEQEAQEMREAEKIGKKPAKR